MKDFASFLMVSSLCVAACASDSGPGSSATGVNSTAGSSATAAPTGPAAGGSAPSSTAAGGSTASGGAGASAAPSTAPRAGTGAVAAGGSAAPAVGTGGTGTPSAGSGSAPMMAGAAPIGSFKAAYDMALKDMCMGCHTPEALIGSPNLSNVDKAYESLMDKDATTMMPGQCTGMGKLVTPGNCETSLLYNKIAEDKPKCGRHMPLGSDNMPTRLAPAALEAVCAWIKAGAKKD